MGNDISALTLMLIIACIIPQELHDIPLNEGDTVVLKNFIVCASNTKLFHGFI